MEALRQNVTTLLEQEPGLLPDAIAAQLQVSEFAVVSVLPQDMTTVISGDKALSILEDLTDWGPVTTIVRSSLSIFEVKASFPKGKMARGYYNLMGRDGQLHGHLKLDDIADIALISKPFMGTESHYFGFFNAAGESIFKIYLGRDKKRQLLPEQVSRFMALKEQLK